MEPAEKEKRDEGSDGDNVEPAEKKKRYEDSDDNNNDTEMHNKQVKRYASFCMQMKSMNK